MISRAHQGFYRLLAELTNDHSKSPDEAWTARATAPCPMTQTALS